MKTKKWPIILYLILILAIVGLVCYQIFVAKNFDSKEIVKIALIVIGAVLGIIKLITGTQGKTLLNKKELYLKAYGEFIGNAFVDFPKGKKALFRSLDDYNEGKYANAIKKLNLLSDEYQCAAEQRTITFFLALNYENLPDFERAAEYYEKSVRISQNAVAYGNLARCYSELGRKVDAIEAFESSIHIDPKYAKGYHNFAQYYLRLGEYEKALPLFHKANELDASIVPTMVGLSVCYAMMDEPAQYEHYYRMAVANGYDGKKIKNYIQSLESGA